MVRSATEGVTVSKLFSELTIGLSRDDGPPGDINIGGILFKAGTTVVIPGATVVLWVNGMYQGSDTTGSDGRYLFTVNFEEGSYSIYTEFTGNVTYWEDQSPTVYAVYGKIATALSIGVSPSAGAPPLTTRITGLLTTAAGSPLGGKTVHLYRNGDKIKSMTTKMYSPGQGAYDFTDVITESADYYVEFEGDDEYAGCEEEESVLPCTVCGYPIPLAPFGSEVECHACHSVFETVIV